MEEIIELLQLELRLGRTRAREIRPKKVAPHVDHRKELVKLLEANASHHRTWEVFRDFCEMGACAISNAVDRANRQRREDQYMQVVRRYTPEEVRRFPVMLAHLTEALDVVPMQDVLGKIFGELGLQSHWKGQFFTPDSVAGLMARLSMGDDLKAKIAEKGFVTLQEPCVGAGVLVIAWAQALVDERIEYQRAMHATCVDADATAVHMAYLQLSLLGIPAVVVHGNAICLEEWGRWYTPIHVLGGWAWKLQRRREEEREYGNDSREALPEHEGAPAVPQQLEALR